MAGQESHPLEELTEDPVVASSDPHAQIAGDVSFGRWRQTVHTWNFWRRAKKLRQRKTHGEDQASPAGSTAAAGFAVGSSAEEADEGEEEEEEEDEEEEDECWPSAPLELPINEVDVPADDLPEGAEAALGDHGVVAVDATSMPSRLAHPFHGRVSGGLRRYSPELYNLIVSQHGARRKAGLLLFFILADAFRFITIEWVQAPRGEVNVISLIVIQDLVSLIIALATSFAMEGQYASEKIFSWHAAWRFFRISLLFTVASMFIYLAYSWGAQAGVVATLGNLYVPLTALLSFLVMKRMYGKLEWLSLFIITLAVTTFILLRERAKAGQDVMLSLGVVSTVAIILSVVLSVVASILAERIFKDVSLGLIRVNRGQRHDRFYIHKVHLDFTGLLMASLLWLLPVSWHSALLPGLRYEGWFGNWGWPEALAVCVAVLQSWLAGIVTKHFSTVIKSIAQTMSAVVVIVVMDPLLFGDFAFDGGLIPSVSLAVIVMCAAIVFQTGRLQVRALKREVNIKTPAITSDLRWWEQLRRNLVAPQWEQAQEREEEPEEVEEEEEEAAEPEDEPTSDSDALSERSAGIRNAVFMYSSFIVFILADSGRTLSQQAALSKSMITPQSMVLLCFLSGILIASIMTAYTDGLEGLKLAFSPAKTARALPCAFFFALAQTLMSIAYALGISPALATVLGYVYMPVSAIASRWVLGKFYMWLEWIALIILTLASAVFGFLQQWYGATRRAGQGSQQHQPSSLLAMGMILGSAVCSVFGSLVAEKILKRETLPFHIQKVRLDVGSVLTTLLLLPVIGGISSRPQDAFWRPRVLDATCPARICWAPPSPGSAAAASSPAAWGCASTACTDECPCGSGIFAAWDNWLVIFALAINVAQGWLGGKVAKQFSTVMRAIAQSCSLLVIYFIGDPLINGQGSVRDASMTLMALIVPLSTCIFMVAVGELEKVTNLSVNQGNTPAVRRGSGDLS